MSNEFASESRTEAARAFVEHLRQNPTDARTSPEKLAERFGLDVAFVKRALARVPNVREEEVERDTNAMIQRAGGFIARIDGWLERAAKNPIRFEIISLVVAIAIMSVVQAIWGRGKFGEGVQARPSELEVTFRGLVSFATILIAIFLQMVVFYRRRMARFAVYGGLVFWVGTSLPLMTTIWWQLQNTESELKRGGQVLLVGFAMFFMGLIYSGLAAFASVLGGWVHLKRADEEWEQLSRHELLERYFELQKRLEQSVSATEDGQAWESWPVIASIRQHPMFSAMLMGVLAGLIQGVLREIFHITPKVEGPTSYQVVSFIFELVALAAFGIIAFLSGSAVRGAIVGLIFTLAVTATMLLPIGGTGLEYLGESSSLYMMAFSLFSHIFGGAIIATGATIQKRAVRDQRLHKNDQATLVAEMLDIQWRLEEDATSVTVMVVDAAKSTAMKVGADPLDVEYSFREYQMWIAECCAAFGGRVHSVAGDGAVVAFDDNGKAMAAARRIQTDLVNFNAEFNRLPKPFRLRLGLHAGHVAGDLNDVQFTEVIDIAAHVEEIAPVGGIAATVVAIAGLDQTEFLPLAREIDGQPVFLALVPTEA